MQISIETISILERRMNVVVPAESFTKTENNILEDFKKKTKPDGFRPGKAPIAAIKKLYGKQARAEAVDKLFYSSLSDAMKQEKLKPIENSLVVESMQAEDGQPMKYTVKFEIYPEVHLKDLSNVSLEKLVVAINEKDVDEVLEKIRQQHTTFEAVDRAAELGDQVLMDVVNSEDGSVIQQDFPMVLKEGVASPAFLKLKGAKVGDKIQYRDLEENKDSPENQKNNIQLVIKKISAPHLPVIDEAFAKKLGVEDATVETLRKEVQEQMQHQLDMILKNKLSQQLAEKLLEMHPLQIPESLIKVEAERLQEKMKEDMARYMGQKKSDGIELPEQMKANSLIEAKRRVSLGLLLSEAIQKQELKVDEKLLFDRIRELAGSFEDPENTFNWILKQEHVLQKLRGEVLETQVMDKLLEQVKFTEKSANYSDLMKGDQHHHHEHVHDENCNHDH